jgi:hypothetical protein
MDFSFYDRAVAADNAWSKELQKKFGRHAGDARYTPKGRSTPRLRELCEAKLKADREWREYIDRCRAASLAQQSSAAI